MTCCLSSGASCQAGRWLRLARGCKGPRARSMRGGLNTKRMEQSQMVNSSLISSAMSHPINSFFLGLSRPYFAPRPLGPTSPPTRARLPHPAHSPRSAPVISPKCQPQPAPLAALVCGITRIRLVGSGD